MAPAFASGDPADLWLLDPEAFGHGHLCRTCLQCGEDRPRIRLRDLAIRVRPTVLAILAATVAASAVPGVVARIPKVEVVRSDAWRVVAVMQNPETVRYRAMVQFPRHPVRLDSALMLR
jgi:hypothetical protein